MKKAVNSDRELIVLISILALLVLLSGCATALHSAILKGDINGVKALLDQGADINERFYEQTPLMYASAKGNNEMVNLLLKRGANINAGSKEGVSSLGVAAENTHVSTVKLLISKGADTDRAIIGLDKRAAYFSSFPPLPSAVARCRSGSELIKNIVRRQESAAAQAAKPSTLTKEDLTMIVQAAVEGASKTRKNKTKVQSSVQSDIDKPFFSTESIIMDDNDYAIIIGVEGYSSLPKSDYSYDDAKLVKDYFKALGIKERNIELLIDEKATLSGIMKSIEAWLPNKLKKGGKIFVYYSGHGAPDPVTGEAFIVPYDGDPNYLNVTGYPLKRLYKKLGRLQASEVIVVLDSCFSGAGGRSVLAKGARPLVMTSQSAVLPQNMVVL
ncbi:MAG: ankyrin repeat domain-containing protein, partial [Deltaproteobacteria bacterium]|nr:ankyrin repeat domain-containing protein [Deltaproteobacteria bacterium]